MNKDMKVVIVNKSDSIGGAAVVALRLVMALASQGIDARMLVIDHHHTQNFRVKSYAGALDKINFLAERLQIFTQNGFCRENLFKVDTASWGSDISQHPWIKEADIINLHWINQGALSLKGVENLLKMGKRIVWTMHDMWNCTGICHHAYDCEAYKTTCGECRYLQSSRHTDLSTHTQRKKAKLYSQGNITFVAVSNWLAQCCAQSALLRDADVRVIHNAFPIEDFTCQRQENGSLGITSNKKVIVMGAARLDDSVKGFEYFINLTKHIAQERSELSQRLHFVLFGNIRNKLLLDEIAVPFSYLGPLANRQELVNVYTQSDVVLSTSLYETLPGTIIEGLACGCVPVSFGNGGQADIFTHKQSGYIANYCDSKSLADGIEWAIDSNISRKELHEQARIKFSSQNIAKQYIKIYEE